MRRVSRKSAKQMGWAATALTAFLAFSGMSQPANAQNVANWPDRTIRMIVPFPPGATPDMMARLVGEKLAERLKQPVVVENKSGGSGIIAITSALNAPADGYTLFLADTGHTAINPALRKDLPYDPLRDLQPISRLTEQNFSVIVRDDSPARTLADLVELSRKREKGITYGTSGIGSAHHMGGEQLRLLTGGNFMHVPYKGMIQTVPALLSGEVDFMIGSATPVMSHWKDGKVRILARGSEQRSQLMPDVPTLRESGVPMNIAVTLGLFVRAGTPDEIVERLSKEVNLVLQDPALQKRVAGQDFTIAGTTPQEYADIVRSQIAEYKEVVEKAGIEVQ